MLYFIFLSQKCNLNCVYCGGNQNPKTMVNKELDYPLKSLIRFLRKDPNPIVAFYGGEPLLNIPMLEKIIDQLKNAIFVLQTNGLLLNYINSFYLKHIQTILVSIDGPEYITDYYRNKGTYKHILQNISEIRNKGFQGDLIARMTISVKSDIYRDVMHLYSLKNPYFDHIHWQLDVIWAEKNKWKNFENWIYNSYNTGITKLVRQWIKVMQEKRLIMGIVPFIGIMRSLLLNIHSKIRCGAGIDSFAIQTNGTIYACPVCPEFDDFKVGTIYDNNPKDLKESLLIQSPCIECDIYTICGGRCLFTNHHNFWGEDFFNVCKTVKHLVSELERSKPIVKDLLKKKIINLEMFDYPKFNNTCEIIP